MYDEPFDRDAAMRAYMWHMRMNYFHMFEESIKKYRTSEYDDWLMEIQQKLDPYNTKALNKLKRKSAGFGLSGKVWVDEGNYSMKKIYKWSKKWKSTHTSIEFLIFATYVEVFYNWRRHVRINDGPHRVILKDIWEFNDSDIEDILGEKMCMLYCLKIDSMRNYPEVLKIPDTIVRASRQCGRGWVNPYMFEL